MLLDENNYKEQIHAFTQQDWKPLIELIPNANEEAIPISVVDDDELYAGLKKLDRLDSVPSGAPHCLIS